MCFIESSMSLSIPWHMETASFLFLIFLLFFCQPSVPPGVVPKACPNVAYAASRVLKCLLNDVSCHLLWLMAAGAEREGWTYLSVRC